jgi:MFS transporter, DHA1 family, tetracycline resistance protein
MNMRLPIFFLAAWNGICIISLGIYRVKHLVDTIMLTRLLNFSINTAMRFAQEPTMKNKNLIAIFIIVFIDLLGFSLILPLLPYYAQKYNASAVVAGFLVASYAAGQFIGAPIIGRLSDKFGRRPMLLLSLVGTMLGFIVLSFADPLGRMLAGVFKAGATGAVINGTIIGVLFFSRILDGLTGGDLSVAQAYISDVTDERHRARGLGLIGAAFGLGFIIGPAIGGTLSVYGYNVPALLAAGLSLVAILATLFWLPESLSAERRAELAHHPRAAFTLRNLLEALGLPRVGPLLHVRLFFGLAFNMFQTVFSLYASLHLGLDARSTAYILTYVGVLAVLVQGLAIAPLTKRFAEKTLIFVSITLMAVGLLAWAIVPNLWLLLIVLAPISLAGGILGTVLNSALTKSVYPEEIGGTLGLSTSLESVTRAVAPSLGGLLIGGLGTWAPGVFGALVMTWLIAFTWRRLLKRPDPPLPGRDKLSLAPDSIPGAIEGNVEL